MKKDTRLPIRLNSDFKERLQKAAQSRGLSVSAYIRDRIEDHVRADLQDLRKFIEDDEYAEAA